MNMSELRHDIRMTRRGPRRGFSFTEVLFAVMVLGVGFIMIAAMFPVTLRQTQTTMEETHAANLGREALAFLQAMASDDLFPVTVPPTGAGGQADPSKPSQVMSFTDVDAKYPPPAAVNPRNKVIAGNFVSSGNPRLGWTALYQRGLDANGVPLSYAQVFLIPMQVRNRSRYFSTPPPAQTYSDFVKPSNGTQTTFEPRTATVSLTYDATNLRGQMTISGDGQGVAAPGAYVVIADDKTTGGAGNGRVYRLGNAIDAGGGVWSLIPGSDMIRNGSTEEDKDLNGAKAYIVGKGYGSLDDGSTFEGPAQDIGLYVGFVRIPPKAAGSNIVQVPAGI